MKNVLALLAVVFAATFIAGCGNGNVPVKITNDLGAWNIEEIYIDLASEPWGANRITDIIEPGEDVTISVPVGTYDLKIVDEDGDTYTIWGQEIGAEGFSWAVTLSDID
jgi:archaellum component FlaF (FlaF/FlaG flagellin family)